MSDAGDASGGKTAHDMNTLMNGLNEEQAMQEKEERINRANKILLNNPIEFLLNEVEKEVVGNRSNITMCIYSLLSLNPCVKNLLHMQHIGNVQSGKSHMGLTCESLLNIDMQFPVKHMSPKYLVYASKTISVKNKLIIIDDATDDDIELLKSLGNNLGPATHGTVANHKAETFMLDGEPLIWFSTVTPLDDEGNQLNSRYIMINTDETEEHHGLVLEKFKDEVCESKIKVPIDNITGDILEMCINSPEFNHIRMPRFDFPAGISTRYRDGKAFISLVQAVAVLNHKTRVIKDPDLTLYAAPKDIEIATTLWKELDRYNIHKLNEQQVQTYELILNWSNVHWDVGIAIIDLMTERDRKKSQIYRDIKVLTDCGLIFKNDAGGYNVL